jgi:multiple sugar transport system substrate-binding protein
MWALPRVRPHEGVGSRASRSGLALGRNVAASLALAGCGGTEEEGPVAEPFPVGNVTHPRCPAGRLSHDAGVHKTPWPTAFQRAAPNVTVDTQGVRPGPVRHRCSAPDLSAGRGPDIVTQTDVQDVLLVRRRGRPCWTLSTSEGKLLGQRPKRPGGRTRSAGKTYGVPVPQDAWVPLTTTRNLFDKAQGRVPGRLVDVGRTTQRPPRILTHGLKAAGLNRVRHLLRALVAVDIQGFALGQSSGADLVSGKFGYLKVLPTGSWACRTPGRPGNYPAR